MTASHIFAVQLQNQAPARVSQVCQGSPEMSLSVFLWTTSVLKCWKHGEISKAYYSEERISCCRVFLYFIIIYCVTLS